MEYKLEEVFEFIRNGSSIKQFDTYEGYPITRIETIANGYIDIKKMGYANITSLGKYEDYLLKNGDILMSHINSEKHLGKCAIYEDLNQDIIHGMNLLCLRPNKELLYPKYAYYYFNTINFRKQLPKITKKSVNQASFSVNDLKKLKINILPIDIQIKVVEVLDKAQELIDKRKEQIEQLDELVKSRFIEMFGNPVINSKNWRIQKMKNVAPTVAYKGDFNENKVWLLNLDMVESNTGNILGYNYVTMDEVGSSTCTFDTTNVLYSKLRPYLNKVVIPNEKGYATSEMVPLKPAEGVLNRYYLTYMLRNKSFVDYISEKVSGAKMPRVTMNDFRDFNVPIPPIELQNQFADFVNQVDKLKFEMEKSLKELEDNFNSLMQKAFKGELF